MKPTKEQLADPKWWNENAPSDEYDFFLEDAEGVIRSCFNKLVDGRFIDFGGFEWCRVDKLESGTIVHKRPSSEKKWRGPEDGLPPVGIECEALAGVRWISCDVVAHFRGRAVAVVSGGESAFVFDLHELRPLKSKEYLEREKAIDRMLEEFHGLAAQNAAKIYDAGYRHRDTFAEREAELLKALSDLARSYRQLGLDVAHDPQLKKAEALLKNANTN